MKNLRTDDARFEGGVREAAVAGMFYPEDPKELAGTIERMMHEAAPQGGERIRGIIAPHAGYMYSGPTAARAYGLLAGATYETVAVVAPSHREFFEGVSVFDGTAYRTPLGIVPINVRLREDLIAHCACVHASRAGHREEHAVEVQLPFLQKALGEFTLLPLVIGHQTPETCFELGRGLAQVLGDRNALLVASTDLSHFYPDQAARSIDAVTIGDVRRFDGDGLMSHLTDGAAEACGGGPTVAVMTALKILGAAHMDVVGYATSGDITGDRTNVVGYLGAVAI
ncbi:MAG TPA: AmmeMemoRadiSam system protein B [Bacteroidota bacterium]|nr:AmmeMemoRadiSam system protein B [Bacteroidota bacterium]